MKILEVKEFRESKVETKELQGVQGGGRKERSPGS
jgi:hypothetical protein